MYCTCSTVYGTTFEGENFHGCTEALQFAVAQKSCNSRGKHSRIVAKRLVKRDKHLQVFAIEFVAFAIEFVPFAIEFIGIAIEFVGIAIEFVPFAIEFVPFAIEFIGFAVELVGFAIEFVAFALQFVINKTAPRNQPVH